MFRKLLQTGQVDVDGHVYVVHYFESKTARGLQRFSGEVMTVVGDFTARGGISTTVTATYQKPDAGR